MLTLKGCVGFVKSELLHLGGDGKDQVSGPDGLMNVC